MHAKLIKLVAASAASSLGCLFYTTTPTDVDTTLISLPTILPTIHGKERNLQLRQVQVLFRHGARTPIHYRPGSNDDLRQDEVVWDREKLMRTLPHVDIPLSITGTER